MSILFLITQALSFWNTLYSNGRHWVIWCLQLISHLMKCWEMKETKWFHSWVLIGLSVANLLEFSLNSFYKLTTHRRIKYFTPGSEEVNWTLKIFFTCTFCLVERKVTFNWPCFKSEHSGFFLLSIIFSQKEKKMEWKSNTIFLLWVAIWSMKTVILLLYLLGSTQSLPVSAICLFYVQLTLAAS